MSIEKFKLTINKSLIALGRPKNDGKISICKTTKEISSEVDGL